MKCPVCRSEKVASLTTTGFYHGKYVKIGMAMCKECGYVWPGKEREADE